MECGSRMGEETIEAKSGMCRSNGYKAKNDEMGSKRGMHDVCTVRSQCVGTAEVPSEKVRHMKP